MIRKETSEGIGYSVVELGQVRHVFASAAPQNGGDLEQQTHDALKTIEAVIDDEAAHGSIVKQAVFLRNIEQVEACRAIIKEFYGAELPATSYIQQAPCNDKLVAIEALGVGRGFDDVEIRRLSDRMVVTSHDGVEWVHLANLTPRVRDVPLFEASLDVFEQMAAGLAEYGYNINQVIRTWLYLGDIVGPEADTQRFK
ncbi:MAG: Rid family hydrolase, partial [Patescibacteria group bacterium]|nr:Rid family hydrolase [Patescibacteria group bacterium]